LLWILVRKEYYNKALEIHTGLNNRYGLAADYWGIAITYVIMDKNEDVLDYYNKALKINIELKAM
jgi:hypothetical protein